MTLESVNHFVQNIYSFRN